MKAPPSSRAPLLALVVTAVIAVGWWLWSPEDLSTKEFTGPAPAEQPGAPISEAAAAPAENPPSAPQPAFVSRPTPPPPAPEVRLPRGLTAISETLDESLRLGPDGHWERRRLVRIPSESSPVVIKETLAAAPDGEPGARVAFLAWIADQVALGPLDPDGAEPFPDHLLASRDSLLPASPWSQLRVLRLESATLDAVDQAIARLEGPAAAAGWIAERNVLLYPAALPNDPQLTQQWAHSLIDSAGAWSVTTGNATTYVAVLDSGVSPTHPDLSGNLATEYGNDFASPGTPPNDNDGHGTFVSGILGAVGNNSIGIAGVAWTVRIIPIRMGDSTFTLDRITSALDYVRGLKRNDGVNVVATNNSYGFLAQSSNPSFLLSNAIHRHRNEGILFVAAAGNDGKNLDGAENFYPAGYDMPHILSVTATTSSDGLWGSSNTSATRVHLGAPGVGIRSTTRTGSYANGNGTSYAAPHVAGAVALIHAANPDLSWSEIRAAILDSVDPLPVLDGKTSTGGRLNLGRAVRQANQESYRIHLIRPLASSVRLLDPAVGLVLEPEVRLADEPLPQLAESVTWEFVGGPAAPTWSTDSQERTVASFAESGDYHLRAVLEIAGTVEAERHLLVAVGPDAPLSASLTGHWEFASIEDGTVADRSGHGRHGALQNVAPFADNGPAGEFAANASRVVIPDLPVGPTVSFVARVRATGPGSSIFPRIIDTPAHIFFWGREDGGFFAPNDRTLRFYEYRSGADGVWHTAPGLVGDGEWVHVAVTYDGTAPAARPLFFYQGAPVFTISQGEPAGELHPQGTTTYIGNNAALDRPWRGQIAEVRMYDRVLHPVEIAQLADSDDFPVAPFIEIPPADALPLLTAIPLPATNLGPDAPALTVSWLLDADPGAGGLSDGDSLNPILEFTEEGTYGLMLETDDGLIATRQSWTLTVIDDRPLLTLASPNPTTLRSPRYPVALTLSADRARAEPWTALLAWDDPALAAAVFPDAPAEVAFEPGQTTADFTLSPAADPDASGDAVLHLGLAESTLYRYTDPGLTLNLLSPTFPNFLFSFTGANHASISSAEAALDSDLDGVPDLLEFALGLDPLDGGSGGHPHLPVLGQTSIDGETFLTLAFTRLAGLENTVFSVEASDDPSLPFWPDAAELLSVEPLPEGLERVTYRDLLPLGTGAARFLRLRVTVLEPTH
ncbi:MAG: hypothetical protein EA425_12215 [Puniceicoccaceae bacterium]|nr:MAG: hypothetical protein EA425_12215 [Puniceicoccaceae bacterium]